MKPGDLFRVYVPPSSHPRDDDLHGKLVVFLGGRRTWFNKEMVNCLVGDVPRFIYTIWLEDPQ